MTSVPESVRDAMIEAAWLLIAERGLEGMSTREVLARTGAPRGSVYHYFPRGRTELIELAIDHSRRWMQDQIDAIQAQTPADVVAGYLDIWRRVVESTDFHAGCAVVRSRHRSARRRPARPAEPPHSTTPATHSPPSFRQAGSAATDAAERATLLICAAEGAVTPSPRTTHRIEPLALIAEQLRGGQA